MICYKDMTFCSAACATITCRRNWNAERQAAADAWWGKPGAPVAFSDFSDTCQDFQPKEEHE